MVFALFKLPKLLITWQRTLPVQAEVAAGGGESSTPSLTIQEPVGTTEINETSVTIGWTTSDSATSQIIYAQEGENHNLDLNDTGGTAPK